MVNEISFLKEINRHLTLITNFEQNSNVLNQLNEEFKDLDNFLQNSSGIRFLAVGKYSTGKSSFLNNIIGYNLNLLQTSISECTKFALIIKYTKSKEDICLIEAEKVIHSQKVFIKEKNNGEYIIGEENIKNRITQLNNTNELKYYILKTPIQILDEYNYDDEIKEKLEFLDFPWIIY
jgi:hypothetical protein